jgi:DNA-binding transcriptional ArsR family regulator
MPPGLASDGKIKLPCGRQRGNMNLMGRKRIEEPTPDLFPTEGASGPSSNQVDDVKARRPRPVTLPKDLPTAIQYLNDADLDRLLRAATEEAKRRGRLAIPETPRKTDSPSGESSLKQALPTHPRSSRPAAIPLTRGQINAVLAAFKAGVTPSRIARQFGLSQSQVREALASMMKMIGLTANRRKRIKTFLRSIRQGLEQGSHGLNVFAE